MILCFFFFFQAEDGIRDIGVTGVQTCALPILRRAGDRLGQLGLADASRPLDQHGLAEALREVGDQRCGLVGEVSDLSQALPDLGNGPGILAWRHVGDDNERMAAVLPHSIGPYVSLMIAGFIIGILGHLFRSRWLVGIGIILIFLAALALPLALNVTTEKPEAPGPLPNPY